MPCCNSIFLGDSTQVQLLEIPKILENIFGFVDLSSLKSCRGVSSNWCLEASRIMQARVVVKLHEEETTTNGRLRDILLSNKSLLPFRYLEVDITKWSNGIFEEILSDPRLLLRSVNLRRSPKPNNSADSLPFRTKLHQLLTTPRHRLHSLLLNFTLRLNLFDLENAELEKQGFILPQLEELSLTSDVTGGMDSLDLILKLFDSAPKLRKLYIMDLDAKFIDEILLRGNLRTVQDFECVFLRPSHFNKISSRNFPSLRVLDALIGFFNQLDSDFYSSDLPLELVTGVSPTIQDLQISWNLKSYDNCFPYCPRLSSLKIKQWGGGLSAFSHSKCPSLKVLNFSEDIVGSDETSITEPNPSLENFILMCGEQHPEGLHSLERFHDFLSHVSVQFPCLKTLELAWTIRFETIGLLVRDLPHLESLILDTRCGFCEEIFTGIPAPDLENYLKGEEEEPDERCSSSSSPEKLESLRKTCLTDMRNLRTLTLTCRIYDKRKLLTNNSIEYGIGRMGQLEELRLDWNADLSLPIAAKSLCHLKRVEILNVYEFRRCSTLQDLKAVLPQTEWREIRYNNYDYDEDENIETWESEEEEDSDLLDLLDRDDEEEDDEETEEEEQLLFDSDDLTLNEFLESDFYEHDNSLDDL